MFARLLAEAVSRTEDASGAAGGCPQSVESAVLRAFEDASRTVGGRFRYRMHIPCTPNPLYRVRWKTLCISLQKLRLDISGDNTGNSQLYPQGVAGAKMWYKTKMPQSEL